MFPDSVCYVFKDCVCVSSCHIITELPSENQIETNIDADYFTVYRERRPFDRWPVIL